MGSPISPIFAKFFMQKLEDTLVPTSGLSLYVWSRYVDDIFTIVKTQDLDEILNSLNEFNPSISFTHEKINQNEIAFLDVLITTKEDFSLGVTVYRKKTDTSILLRIIPCTIRSQ